MKWIAKIKEKLLFDTFGAIATASFLICGISGIIIAVFYDVDDPLNSLSLILISNPGASFFRDIHYWSAQSFLIFTILHLWDHVKAGTVKNQTWGIWLRLTISVVIVFFVMITGFILKGDADSLQARSIIESLIEKISFAGQPISAALFGSDNDFQLIYVHHIATATIFLAVIIWEHAKTLWVRLSTFIITLVTISLFSIFLHAPLHGDFSEIVKGPWYFVGLQEILHWLSHPGWIWVLIILLLLLLYILFHLKESSGKFVGKILFYLFVIYSVLTITGYFFRGENWHWIWPWQHHAIIIDPFRTGADLSAFNFSKYSDKKIPSVRGRKEACTLCHENVPGLSPSHDPQALGCTSCHLGDPFTLDKNRAHRNLVLIPGNLDDAPYTCGTTECHPEIVSRVAQSLMTTNSGIVSTDRFVFGEDTSTDVHAHIHEIQFTAADQHLRNLCSNCHLGFKKTTTGPIDELSRGGGCNACHLNYSSEARTQHETYIAGKKQDSLLPGIHPVLNLNMAGDHCFGCHSRSGRISTNYEGWHETLLNERDVLNKKGYRTLSDKRVFEFIADDIHHEKGLDCIDCHVSYEVMGDGNIYLHEEQAMKIQCTDCHCTEPNRTVRYQELDAESRKIFDLRTREQKDSIMVAGKNSRVNFINTFFEFEKPYLIDKNSGKIHPMNAPASVCMKDKVHSRLTCSSCHSSWAPHCIGCHNEFDKKADGFDLFENKPVKGSWVEFTGKFIAEPPSLGVSSGEKGQIEPCVPGMILSVDKSDFIHSESDNSIINQRLYAPVSPHTTSAKGRNCKSCHNNPLALGYGRGELTFNIEGNKGRWVFKPLYAASENDGLPEDAWIGFLTESKGIVSTRVNFRPFTPEEQKKILTVGACLHCHEEKSNVIQNSLDEDFSAYLLKISDYCIIPQWD